jgi:hypothetical protein
VNFSQYLISKKIDEKAFSAAEPDVFSQWNVEFGQMHENSFTIQKLNLINPLRRKYQLKEPAATATQSPQKTESPAPATPKVAKPVFKPKPKL